MMQKFPSFFSAKNQVRKYKIDIKGDEGTIIFTEKAKKDFILMAFKWAVRHIKDGKKVSNEDIPKEWSVIKPEHLSWLSTQIRSYIKDVETQVRNKHSDFTIFKHELVRMDFVEVDSKTYDIKIFVKIWVSV